MPSISFDVKELDDYGPRLEVVIAPPKITWDNYKKAGLIVPRYSGHGLIDTGAEKTTIHKSVAIDLGFDFRKTRQMGAAGSNYDGGVHEACIILPELNLLFPIEVISTLFPSDRFQVLIGRDILKYGVFLYDGKKSYFKIELNN